MKKNVGVKNNNNINRPNNSNKKQINRNGIPSNFTSVNHIQINNSSNTFKNVKLIYDDNYISLINELSRMINILNKSNNTNFSKMKNFLDIHYSKNGNQENIDKNSVVNSFNQIETSFNDFYSNVKTLFQRMKNYENNININKNQKNNIFKSIYKNNKLNDNIENDFDNINVQRAGKNINNNKNEYNLVKVNYQNIKNNKLTNRSSSLITNNNFSPKRMENKQQRVSKYNNSTQNNTTIVYSLKNGNDIDKNLNLIIEENKQLKNKNIYLEKKNKNLQNLMNSSKNSSSCNIRVNKPTRIIMDHSLMLNDLSMDKSFIMNNNNSMSTTHKNNKDMIKSFSTTKNNF